MLLIYDITDTSNNGGSVLKIDIKNFNLEELKQELILLGEKSFRAEQIFKWLYQDKVKEFAVEYVVSTSLDGIFTLFLQSIDERDKSHFAAEDTYNTILTKIFQSKILEQAQFFTTATSLKQRAEGFARRYALL